MMKLALRIIQYALLVPFNLFFTAFCAIFINWWAVFFAVPASPWLESKNFKPACQMLPRWLSWVDTFDASIDAGWVHQYFETPYTLQSPPPFWTRKWLQIRWLYRNCAYGFSYWPLGIAFDKNDWTFRVSKTDTRLLFIATSKHGHFNIMYQGPLGEYKLGWKAWNYLDTETLQWRDNYTFGPEARTMMAFTPNPFKH